MSKMKGFEMVTNRNQISPNDRWNVESLYSTDRAWQEDFERTNRQQTPPWTLIEQYRGKLHEGPQNVATLLDALYTLDFKLRKLSVYAQARHDENTAEATGKVRLRQVYELRKKKGEFTAWIMPQLRALGDLLSELGRSKPLESYRFYLRKEARMLKHSPSPELEALLALSGPCQISPHLAYKDLINADMKFFQAIDRSGVNHNFTQTTYSDLIKSKDPVLRKSAYESRFSAFAQLQNTLAQLLGGTYAAHAFDARARNYSSSLQRTLFEDDIPEKVYENLVKTTRARASSLQGYLQVRRKCLNVETLNPWDLSVPLFPEQNRKIPLEDAKRLIIEAAEPLGDEYVQQLAAGLSHERWLDPYASPNKRSDNVQYTCWGFNPLISFNYNGQMQNVFALASMAGHAMHTYFSNKSQPYHRHAASDFTAKAASSLLEELLFRHLANTTTNPQERGHMIDQKLQALIKQLFQMTLLAEFEREAHSLSEKGEGLTPQTLQSTYRSLYEHYFAPACTLAPLTDMEWASYPHLHREFYTFQFATGSCAALALCQQLRLKDAPTQERLLNLLKAGGSDFPLQQLRDAGIDMSSSVPIDSAIDRFDDLVRELDQCIP